MKRDIESRADELTFGFGDEAIEEGILRVHDNLGPFKRPEGERWLSAIFVLVRRAKLKGAPPSREQL
jgi:hypothetical protein